MTSKQTKTQLTLRVSKQELKAIKELSDFLGEATLTKAIIKAATDYQRLQRFQLKETCELVVAQNKLYGIKRALIEKRESVERFEKLALGMS